MASNPEESSDSGKGEIIRDQNQHNRVTIGDVAQALGVSKTTVSRAISGKGRISEKTRTRVLSYVEQNHYTPNVSAKGLANSKTYNIGWVMPGDSFDTDLPFFQRCMMGLSEAAMERDYDILLTLVFDHDISQLKRIIDKQKVDGVVLGRTLVCDERIDLLHNSQIPYVVIGSSTDESAVQIDNDHIAACQELTFRLIQSGLKKLALIGGNENHVVNRTRRRGFDMGLEKGNLAKKDMLVRMNADSTADVEHAVNEALQSMTDCIVCTDDRICTIVLNKLNRDGIVIPRQIKVASFYDNETLDHYRPPITTIRYDPKELGMVACRLLIDYIDGKKVQKKIILGYEILERESTR